jgi:hypothetical protein
LQFNSCSFFVFGRGDVETGCDSDHSTKGSQQGASSCGAIEAGDFGEDQLLRRLLLVVVIGVCFVVD